VHAIPLNTPPTRRRPADAETVISLSHGAADSAERLRNAVRAAVPQAAWSPTLTSDSLREAAACGTAISHHCDILLRTLADRAEQQDSPDVSTALLEAAEATTQARTAWLHAARAWKYIVTDTSGNVAPATAEATDLALWTGRLAYADPAWTLAQGPTRPARPPEDLAPDPANLPGIVAAVHYSCETLTQMAAADHSRTNTADQHGRLHSPTYSLDDSFDIPHPYGPVPSDRLRVLLTAYDNARTASAHATAAIATVAATTRAPSRTLITARAVVQIDNASRPAPDTDPQTEPAPASTRSRDLPGPVERVMTDLGITSPDALLRASALDQAGEQLILQSVHAAATQRPRTPGLDLDRSVNAAELADRASAPAGFLQPPTPASEPDAELEL
jgi:hypothetical protein